MATDVEEIKSRIDVVDLLSDHIKLLPAGANYKALCPFHHERTPSMMISPARQSWRCFGCNEGGDIFTFLMKIENLDFPEALKILAQRAGVTLSRQPPRETVRYNDRLIEACDLARRYWHKVLLESSRSVKAREYANQRGLTEQTIEEFDLGYAIDAWDDLSQFLTKRGFSREELIQSGLAIAKTGGSYDRFRGRLMFPIRDIQGRTVGFGGRVIESTEAAKYMNTPQTAIYNKSAVVYGLYQARQAIKEANLCVIVEGYMDVVPSHQAGIKNVVAISGTALTVEQVKLIKRFTTNITFALDMDSAGQTAALRSIEVASQENMNISMINVPDGKDPGECVAKSPDLWRQAIADRRSLIDYFLARATDKWSASDSDQKKQAVDFLMGALGYLASPVDRDELIRRIGQQWSVSEGVLRELAAKQKPKPAVVSNQGETALVESAVAIASKDEIMAQRLFSILIKWPVEAGRAIDQIKPEMLSYIPAQTLYIQFVLLYNQHIDAFAAAVGRNQQGTIAELLSVQLSRESVDQATLTFFDKVMFGAEGLDKQMAVPDIKRELELIIKTLITDYINRSVSDLQRHLRLAEEQGDRAEADRLMTELTEIVRHKPQ